MYDGVRRVSGLRREPAVSGEDLTHIYISHRKKKTPTLSQEFRAGYVLLQIILAREVENIFQWDVYNVYMCEVLHGDCGDPT